MKTNFLRTSTLISKNSKKRVQIVLGKTPRMKWTIFKGDKLSPTELKRIAEVAARARCITSHSSTKII